MSFHEEISELYVSNPLTQLRGVGRLLSKNLEGKVKRHSTRSIQDPDDESRLLCSQTEKIMGNPSVKFKAEMPTSDAKTHIGRITN